MPPMKNGKPISAPKAHLAVPMKNGKPISSSLTKSVPMKNGKPISLGTKAEEHTMIRNLRKIPLADCGKLSFKALEALAKHYKIPLSRSTLQLCKNIHSLIPVGSDISSLVQKLEAEHAHAKAHKIQLHQGHNETVGKITRASAKLKKHSAEKNFTHNDLTVHAKDIAALKAELAKSTEEIKAKNEEIRNQSAIISELKGKERAYADKAKEYRELVESHKSHLAEIEKLRAELQKAKQTPEIKEKIQKLDELKSDNQEKVKEAQVILSEIQSEATKQANPHIVADLKEELQDARATLVAQKETTDNQASELRQLTQLSSSQPNVAAAKEEIKEKSDQLQQHIATEKQLNERIAELERRIVDCASSSTGKDATISELRIRLEALQGGIAATANDVAVVEQIAANAATTITSAAPETVQKTAQHVITTVSLMDEVKQIVADQEVKVENLIAEVKEAEINNAPTQVLEQKTTELETAKETLDVEVNELMTMGEQLSVEMQQVEQEIALSGPEYKDEGKDWTRFGANARHNARLKKLIQDAAERNDNYEFENKSNPCEVYRNGIQKAKASEDSKREMRVIRHAIRQRAEMEAKESHGSNWDTLSQHSRDENTIDVVTNWISQCSPKLAGGEIRYEGKVLNRENVPEAAARLNLYIKAFVQTLM